MTDVIFQIIRDPEQTRTGAEMISALKRAWLLPKEDDPADPVAEAKFALDATVSDEGIVGSSFQLQMLVNILRRFQLQCRGEAATFIVPCFD